MLIPVRVLIEKSDVSGKGTQATLQEYSRSDVFGEPFPNEDTDEDTPEEDAALLLKEDAFAAVHRVEELDLWHDERVDSPSGVHEVAPSEASKAISKQLGRDEPVAQASGQPLQIRRGRENGRRT